MAQIIWAEPALLALEDIAEFIALDKPSVAKKLVAEVFEKVGCLKAFLRSGRKPPELPNKTRYRELIVGPCRIFFRVEKNRIYIIHMMRSEQLLRRYLLE